jgi:DNA-binding GntR family transcriptional regulator
MILSGELASGAQVREEQLAESCGVSRTPIRDALKRLEAELFIRRNSAQRSFVADWSLDEVEEAFDLRIMLECHAVRRASKRITATQLDQLRVLNTALSGAIEHATPDISRFLECNRQFHAIILDAAGSERLTSVLSRIIEQPVVWRTAHNYDRENLMMSYREHEELLKAFDLKDGAWAEAVMSAHIRRAFHTYADAHRHQNTTI